MNEQDIVNKLKSDPRALKSVMQSQVGQAWESPSHWAGARA